MSEPPDVIAYDRIRALEWAGDRLRLIDQRRLPEQLSYLEITSLDGVSDAIRDMAVRGAPAIGIAAAYGVVLGALAHAATSRPDWKTPLISDMERLARARPTAVNLRWAVERMRAALEDAATPGSLLAVAREIHAADIAGNRRMGAFGASLLPEGAHVITHCNTGALATGGFGTALGVIRSAAASRGIEQVYAGETRPWLQGARLTTWELEQEGIPVTLIADSAAAHLMKTRRVDWVIVGADRVAANGDVANKIGTYALALAARRHGVRFMVAAPTTTFDLATPDGGAIQIEQRPAEEVLAFHGQRHSATSRAFNPAFDVTPAELIDALVTERGVILSPTSGRVGDHLRG
ncbi:MAG: S-methyl-5-thioribose-1-phosphate isomerase [Acidiferrobacteraceae bacterium]